MNTEQLMEKYGYCQVPAGTVFYRKGDLNKNGTHFALHPDGAYGGNWPGCEVARWVTTAPMKLLFLISHLTGLGVPQTALVSLYKELIDSDTRFDDLDIKGRVAGALDKIVAATEKLQIVGWLTTLEDNVVLEIFLVPSSLEHIRECKEPFEVDEAMNALRNIELFEPESFIAEAKKAIHRNYGFLEEIYRECEERDYSILQKIFPELTRSS